MSIPHLGFNPGQPEIIEEPIRLENPTIHIKKVEIHHTENRPTYISYPAKDPVAEVIDSISELLKTVAETATRCMDFFWKNHQADFQHIQNGFDSVRNILDQLAPRR